MSLISIVIRTYNEAEHLGQLLDAIALQDTDGLDVETIIVDSGSLDQTLQIAKSYNCRVVTISKAEFTFGRSLNIGCNAAKGHYLVFISGHCIPKGVNWLYNLIAPLKEGRFHYSYGRQTGREGWTKFSEAMIFEKYYPPQAEMAQKGFFCNNANAALLKSVWQNYAFDESLTGLEDMALAKKLSQEGLSIGYVAEATVEHLHDENWSRIRNRFEREAIAMQKIMPEIHLTFWDFCRYTLHGVILDLKKAAQKKMLLKHATQIFAYRLMQYWGSYRGNNDHRKLSKTRKDRYFYPN